jgi:hypothetical protein
MENLMTQSNEQALAEAKATRAQAHDRLTAAETARTAALEAVTAATAAKATGEQRYTQARSLAALEDARAALAQAADLHTLALRDAQDAATAHAQAVAELAAADAAVAAAAGAILAAQAEAKAHEVLRADALRTELAAELRSLVPDAFHRPLSGAADVVSATVQRALDLTAPAHAELQLHTPLSKLRHQLPVDGALAQRRSELLDVEPPRAA